MATPTAPGTTVGELATAGDYTWEWNGYGWDLLLSTGTWFGRITNSSQMYAHSVVPAIVDYL